MWLYQFWTENFSQKITYKKKYRRPSGMIKIIREKTEFQNQGLKINGGKSGELVKLFFFTPNNSGLSS